MKKILIIIMFLITLSSVSAGIGFSKYVGEVYFVSSEEIENILDGSINDFSQLDINFNVSSKPLKLEKFTLSLNTDWFSPHFVFNRGIGSSNLTLRYFNSNENYVMDFNPNHNGHVISYEFWPTGSPHFPNQNLGFTKGGTYTIELKNDDTGDVMASKIFTIPTN